MSSTTRYALKTIATGLFGVPIFVGFGCAFLGSVVDSTLWALVAMVGYIAVSAGPLWYFWSRTSHRPDGWAKALWPVVAAPGFYLLFWVVAFAITGHGYGDALGPFTGIALPYLPLTFWIAFGGLPLAVPVVLTTVLLVSVGAFVLGCRAKNRPAGTKGLAITATAVVAIAAVAMVQVAQTQWQLALLGDLPGVSDEVDLWNYQPFEPGNKLVAPDEPPDLVIADHHPRLDGATALYPVYGAIAQATYQLPEGVDDARRWDFAQNYVPCNTTTEAYRRLISGEADAIFVAQPSKGQLAKAKAAGVELKLTPIGREAFVFFVNADNPVQNLTLAQVQDIYSRRVTNWKQGGGRDEEIVAFQRPEDSGSQTAMLAMVMKDRQITTPMKEEIASGMGGIITRVAEYRNLSSAIGYSFRWYATVMNPNPDIRLLDIEGVAPTPENIGNGSYPLTGELNVVTAGSENPNLPKLLDWLESAQGQALVEKTGYVGR